jgi:hypothetical protein
LAFLVGVILAAFGLLPWWLPATYVAIVSIEVSMALAKAGIGMQIPVYLFWAACFLALDIVASLTGIALQAARRPHQWLSPRAAPRKLKSV